MAKCEWCNGKLSGRQTKFCSVNCKTAANVKEWRRRTKKRAIEYLGGRCESCGYNKCSRAMIFHHPGKKSFGIGTSSIQSWDRIKKELDQCMLLCLNCHAEIHEYD